MEKEFKFCKKCGEKIKKDATFCKHCGAKQNQSAQKTTVENVNHNKTKNNKKSIGLAVLIGIIILGFFGYHEYPNYRSEQGTADIGASIAQKNFGKNQVEVQYNKTDNAFYITPKDSYNLNVPNTEDAFKKFISDIKPKMGSKYISYHTEFINPANTNKYLLSGTSDSIQDNYIHNYSWDDLFDD